MYTSRKKFKISALITRIVFVWKGARAESISLMSLLSSNDYILTQKGKIFLWNTIASQNKFQDGIYSFTGPNFDQNCLIHIKWMCTCTLFERLNLSSGITTYCSSNCLFMNHVFQ